MKIGIEAQRIFRRKKFGMDIVVLELMRHLQRIDRSNEYTVYVAPGPEDRCMTKSANFSVCTLHNSLYPVWEQWLLPVAAKRMNIDILHCTANTAPLWGKTPMVLSLHDTISLEDDALSDKSKTLYQKYGNLYRRFLIPHIVRRAKHLITVSESEKTNIIRMLHVSPDFVTVVHNGVDKRFRPVSDPYAQKTFRTKYQIPERYIALIGNTDPRKNVENAMRAYAEYLNHSHEKLPLVMVHNHPEAFEHTLRELHLQMLREQIHVLGYIENTEMHTFYSLADMFVFPSRREGFGMPVIEAMACGTPVITSNVSSLPEVGGDAALYASPDEYRTIAAQMLHLENTPELKAKMTDAGFAQCKKFTWDAAARKVLTVYEHVYTFIPFVLLKRFFTI